MKVRKDIIEVEIMSENKISSADHKILDDIKPLKALPSFKKFEVRHNL